MKKLIISKKVFQNLVRNYVLFLGVRVISSTIFMERFDRSRAFIDALAFVIIFEFVTFYSKKTSSQKPNA